MISASKSGYDKRFPGHKVVFNANVLTRSRGKIWWGDLDLTLDGVDLTALAAREGEDVYVLYEMDARFKTEKEPNWDRWVARYKADGTVDWQGR
jgi:hypothetical protein